MTRLVEIIYHEATEHTKILSDSSSVVFFVFFAS